MPTMTTPATLPTEEELREAVSLLQGTVRELAVLRWRTWMCATKRGNETPTLAHIGSLYVFAKDSTAALDVAREYVDDVEAHLIRLDSARLGDFDLAEDADEILDLSRQRGDDA